MKKNIIVLLTALAALIIASCTNPGLTPGEVPGTNDTGTVRFSWSDGETASRSRANTILDADKVVITIEAADGTVVYNQKQLNLFNFNGSFISEPLSLKVGSYKLTEYLILNSAGTVIFATPKAGSEQAHLVTMPLPHDFTVTKDGTTKVKPQVVDAAAVTPADFGYTTFSFEEAKVLNFLVSVMIYDATADGFVLTGAALDVTTDTKAYNFALANVTNNIAVNDVAGNYTVTIKKAGYEEYRATFTNAEMKAFLQSPLIITPVKRVVVTFADPGLEAAVRAAISRPSGDIYRDDVAPLTELNAGNRAISNLNGIEHLSSLSTLNLENNGIADLSPLSKVTGLASLIIAGNPLADLTPLAGLSKLYYINIDTTGTTDISALSTLTNLISLAIPNNNISDLSPVATLTNLTSIHLQGNSVTDLSPLSNLTKLTGIYLENNSVADLTPLTTLTALQTLNARGNRIGDLTPLQNNTGVGSGDEILLERNPLSAHAQSVQIPALRGRGATVTF